MSEADFAIILRSAVIDYMSRGTFFEELSSIDTTVPLIASDFQFRHRQRPGDSGRCAVLLRNSSAGGLMINYLEAGDTLDEFLDNFPAVSREAAIATLEEAKALLTSPR